MQKVTVYNYWTWVPGEGLGKIACRKRTQRQIEEMSGILIWLTGEEVDKADLCLDGSYRPPKRDGGGGTESLAFSDRPPETETPGS